MNSFRNPQAQWLGCPASNFEPDRDGHTPDPPFYIVMHTMVGTIASANGRFQNPAQVVSAHYGVGLDGRLVQWVDEKDAAFHAGDWEVNLDSIGIEHEDNGQPNAPRTEALKNASGQLLADICKRYPSIPCARGNKAQGKSGIVLHREVSDTSTACPDSLEVDEIIRRAQTLNGWSNGLESLGGIIKGPPAVASWAAGRLDVFARGGDDGLYHKWFDGKWSGWERLGSETIVSAPSAVSWGAGRIDVFAQGANGDLVHKWFQ